MSAIDIETIQRAARLAAAAADPYLFGRLLPLAVCGEGPAHEWILGYLRALCQLGLNAAARALVEAFGEELRGLPESTDLAARLSSGDPGRVDWSSRRRRFAANLAVLARRDSHAAEAVSQAWERERDGCELHLCRDGNVQIRPAGPVWPPRWLPCLDDHRAAADRRVSIPRTLIPPPLLFDGIGTGWELDFAYRRTHRVFLEASSALYVVEPSAALFAVALHVHDWRDLLADPRVCVFVGEAAGRQFADLLETDAAWPVPQRRFMLRCDADHADTSLQSIIESVAKSRAAESASRRAHIATRYEDRDSAWWAERFAAATREDGMATDRPLRILGLTSIHTTFLQYSMRDCLKALERLGHHTKLLIEPQPYQHLDPTTALRTQIEFDPDLVLILSRMRDECREIVHPAIPSVCWDQDALPWVFDAQRRPQLAWNDFLMGFSAATAPRRFGWPQHRCLPCPMAGSPDAFSPEPLPEDELAPYRCDVSYVSHASATPVAEADAVAGWLPDERLRRIFRAAVERLLPGWLRGGEFPGRVMTAIFDAAAELREQDPVWDDLTKLIPACQRVGDRAFRHVALGWVADWSDRTGRSFALWGNGWGNHARLSKYARGAARNGRELRCIYQASSVNLQLMGFGFLHQRALDGLMAGAFFMCRRSSSDVPAPQRERLLSLLDRYQVTSATELAALRPTGARQPILELIESLGADPRGLCPQWIEIQHQALRDRYPADVIPDFAEIGFTDACSFAQHVEWFLATPQERTRIAARIRRILVEQYSYEARMSEMLVFVRGGFALQAAQEVELAPRPGGVHAVL